MFWRDCAQIGVKSMSRLRDMKRNIVLQAGMVIDKRANLSQVRELISTLRPEPQSLVRIGPDSDGGYLAPDDLDGVVACLSPGVSTECGFDLMLAERGIDIFMADASVTGPPTPHPRFYFTPSYIEPFNGQQSMTFERFADMAHLAHPVGDWLLQMDIEGAEWRVLLSAPEKYLARCRLLIIEFHDLNRVFQASHFDLMASVFKRLLNDFRLVHIHPNNVSKVSAVGDIVIPSIMEFTFHRRDRPFVPAHAPVYPHQLDRDCVSEKPTLVLPRIWRTAERRIHLDG